MLGPKPPEVFDRERAWTTLADRIDSGRPELIFVLGQRRVGKSHVLSPVVGATGGVYYQASRRPEAEQRAELTRRLGVAVGEDAYAHGATVPTWDAFFELVARHAKAQPLVLVIDEYPYLEDVAPGLSTVVQRWVDHGFRQTQLKLILAGSHVTAMRRLEDADQPLFSRRTARIEFEPFDYFDAARFCPRYGPRDRLKAWGLFGALPGHLALLDDRVPLEDNVVTHILDPGARLFDEGERLLDTFVRDAALHYAILGAIAGGEHTWRGICSCIGKSSGSLSRPLNWLLESGMVERRVPVTEPDPTQSRKARYRLVDPYLAFWNRCLSPIRSRGLSALHRPAALWRDRVAAQVDDLMGPVFETAVRDFVARGGGLPFPAAQLERLGGWWDKHDELDVVALSAKGDVWVAECKWGAVTASHLDTLRRRGQALMGQVPGAKRLHLAVFTGRAEVGLDTGEVRAWTAADLFEPSLGP